MLAVTIKISKQRKFDYYLLEGQPFAKVSQVNVNMWKEIYRRGIYVYTIGMGIYAL